MSSLKLYEASEALEIVESWIEEHADELLANGGELSPELAALIDQARDAFEGKVERVALKVRELLATAQAVELEEKRLGQRRKALENAAAAIKAYLKIHLERTGETKIQGTLATVALQKNGQPSITVEVPVDSLPPQWTVQPPPPPLVLNRDEVVAAFKAGTPLPEGITVTVGSHVRIR